MPELRIKREFGGEFELLIRRTNGKYVIFAEDEVGRSVTLDLNEDEGRELEDFFDPDHPWYAFTEYDPSVIVPEGVWAVKPDDNSEGDWIVSVLSTVAGHGEDTKTNVEKQRTTLTEPFKSLAEAQAIADMLNTNPDDPAVAALERKDFKFRVINARVEFHNPLWLRFKHVERTARDGTTRYGVDLEVDKEQSAKLREAAETMRSNRPLPAFGEVLFINGRSAPSKFDRIVAIGALRVNGELRPVVLGVDGKNVKGEVIDNGAWDRTGQFDLNRAQIGREWALEAGWALDETICAPSKAIERRLASAARPMPTFGEVLTLNLPDRPTDGELFVAIGAIWLGDGRVTNQVLQPVVSGLEGDSILKKVSPIWVDNSLWERTGKFNFEAALAARAAAKESSGWKFVETDCWPGQIKPDCLASSKADQIVPPEVEAKLPKKGDDQ